MTPPYSRARHSFGEAVLKSPAGGIAFFGHSRLADGDVYVRFDRGELVVTKLHSSLAMMEDTLESWDRGADTLGQLHGDALYSFVANRQMVGRWIHTQVVFPFTLLGDPALRIPKRP